MAAREDVEITGTMADRWEFNDEVTRVFDEMLERSIPQHQTMRSAVYALGRRYVRDETAIVDLGCSRGEALASFVDEFDGRCRFVAAEISDPMRRAASIRFGRRVDLQRVDLRHGYPKVTTASLTLSVLTLQFVPINYRQRILDDVYASTVPDGAFILVEKILGDGFLDDAFVSIYHGAKERAGYTHDEVERKRLALEGVLVPVTARWNEDLLRGAGFRRVDCFWRWMNFAAWIAVR